MRVKKAIDKSSRIKFLRGKATSVRWDVDQLIIDIEYEDDLIPRSADVLVNAIPGPLHSNTPCKTSHSTQIQSKLCTSISPAMTAATPAIWCMPRRSFRISRAKSTVTPL